LYDTFLYQVLILNRRDFVKKLGYDVEQIKRMERESAAKKKFRED